MGKNPRDPKNVKKLIADAKERQVESAHASWLAGLVQRLSNIRNNGAAGGGTRRRPR
jgi:hypothetical protein